MMRYFFLFFLLCSSLFAELVDEHGQPTAPLLSLFEVLNTPHEGSLETLAQNAQKFWHQKGDRWTFQDRFEEQKEQILPLLEELGCFKTVQAKHNHYQYGVVLGALAVTVEKRIQFLVQEWKRGIRFDEIIFLTGQRPLHPQKEAQFLDHAKTETDMMLLVWQQTSMPPELRAIPLVVIDAPPVPDRGRPTTASTVYAWLDERPIPGTCLVFSSEPYVGYQNSILSYLLPVSFSIETVGPEGGRHYSTAILIDNVAKWLDWESKRIARDQRQGAS